MNNDTKDLFEVILKLETIEDCEELFADLCTYTEINGMVQRIKAAKLLLEGQTYDSILKQTSISSATLSRVSKCVKYGKGYQKFVK